MIDLSSFVCGFALGGVLVPLALVAGLAFYIGDKLDGLLDFKGKR